jgi:hypothetical protein
VIIPANRFLSRPVRWLLVSAFILLLGFAGTTSLSASSQELERREARVQATYLTHLINFTRWSQDHLPQDGMVPEILVIGSDSDGFIASLKYLISQSNIEIGGVASQLVHRKNSQLKNVQAKLKKGMQVVFLMPDSRLDVATVRKLSPSAVIFGFGREFVTKTGGDVSFVSSRNRVKLVLSVEYFRRTSPKLSAKIANLKSVVEIIRKPRKTSE